MNYVALTRFLGNLAVAAGFTAILFVAMPRMPGVSGWAWTLTLFAIAGFAILAPLVAVLIRPGDAKTAWDELSEASTRASYVFGYWCVMAVFLVLLGLVLAGRVPAESAFFMIGLPLGIGPSVFMVWAYLRGRAG